MNEEEIFEKLEEQEIKLNKIYKSVEKTRKYFLWALILSVLVVVLPLIGLLIAIPQFISYYGNFGI